MDGRASFDEDPERYARARPTYPEELFDALFERLPTRPRVVEVGPGTGQATTALVARGADVTAVELGPRFFRRLVETHPGVRVVNEPFETARLEPASFDAVTAATAYHWVRERRVDRPHELLRPGGWIGIVDLIQVDDPVDGGYFDRVGPIYESFGDRRSAPAPTRHEVRPGIADELAASQRFDEPEVIAVDWNQTYTSATYRELLMTYSGTLVRPPEEREALVDQLTRVIDEEFGGRLVRPLVATITLARAQS